MKSIKNPVIPGMAPDPSIIRVGDDYYLATSTFHWQPAVQIFHSTDLANWNLLGYALNDNQVDLRGTNTPAGIWAPHLSYDELTHRYWLVYSHMQNMAGREFNADAFAIWTNDLTSGEWSDPMYLTSIGFDPALYHENGKHYLTILEWETREGYQAPGHIVVAEVDLNTGKVGDWHRVTQGFTTRGCAEAPQIYRHGDYYYLMIAAGGTGYAHGVEIGRSKNIFGPYEAHPSKEPIITSQPAHLFSLGDPDAGHFEMYNPKSKIQKSGHGSLVSTPSGDWYIAHLMSRPIEDTTLNPLGRETSLQKMIWTDDGWLEMADGSNLAKSEVDLPTDGLKTDFDINEMFKDDKIPVCFMTPYHLADSHWVDTSEIEKLKIYGRNSLFSQYEPSILGTRATNLKYSVSTKLSFYPDHYSESAGLGLYYDANNWLYLRLTLANNEKDLVLRPLQAKLGQRKDYRDLEIPVQGAIELRLEYNHGFVQMLYRNNTDEWTPLGNQVDVKYLSDEGVNGEPGEIGGFTGLFNFIGAVDAHQHDSYGEFNYYEVKNLED